MAHKKLCIIPASHGWSADVVLGGKNLILIFVGSFPEKILCTEVLSNKRMIVQLSPRKFLSNHLSHSLNMDT